ncbi:hypothetical protein A9972_18360 [Pseudomonas sp. UME83]|nr:hypothetical protein [Pseudomonas sp. UME83]
MLERVHRLGDFLAGLAFEYFELGNQALQTFGIEHPAGHAAAKQVDKPVEDSVSVADEFRGIGRPVELAKPFFDLPAHLGG